MVDQPLMAGAMPVIREYRDADAPAVRRCIVELQDHERRIDGRLRPGEAMCVQYLDDMLRKCNELAGAILVAECDGEVAGFVTILARVPFEELDDPPGDRAIVSDLAVLARFRRRGLGAALLREADRYAREAGATEIRIGVMSENRGAAQLYRQEGFAPYLEILSKRLDTRES